MAITKQRYQLNIYATRVHMITVKLLCSIFNYTNTRLLNIKTGIKKTGG